jgi:hypothetical protein
VCGEYGECGECVVSVVSVVTMVTYGDYGLLYLRRLPEPDERVQMLASGWVYSGCIVGV